MATVNVRYIVDDVDAAIAFYCQQLGFREEMHPAPAFAMLSRGDLRLVLSAPGGGPVVARPCPTAGCPSPEAGTGSSLRCLISPPPSRRCATTALASAMTLSSGSAASRPCSRIRP
jgi:catechol 2,3-dioxygenase-like lactoylglutathione lyase family enzyme